MASTSQPKRVHRVSPPELPPEENRDPNNLNDHLKVEFYNVIAEPPDGPQTADCTWEFSEIFFNCFLECWYKLLSLLCGVCFAVYWGLQFVPVLFTHVWILTPFRQLVYMTCGVWCKSVWTLFFSCCLKPWTRSCGYFFIHCSDGTVNRSETPPLSRRKLRLKPEVAKQTTEVYKSFPVRPFKGEFDDYDKEKLTNSVKRTMMFY